MVRCSRELASLVLTAFLACDDAQIPVTPDATSVLLSFVDGAQGGNPHFFFLPPIVPEPSYNGDFDGTLAPVVRICEWTGTACLTPLAAEFNMIAGPGSETVRVVLEDEHYIVNWHTSRFDLDPSKIYRIRVFLTDAELGHVDVDVVPTARDARTVDRNRFLPLVNGQTLPIRFRIERGAVTGNGRSVFGLAGFRPLFTSGPNDLTGAHYRFVVSQNEGLQFHIVFAFNRLYSPGSPLSYLIESNVYSGTQYYVDGGCTTWPLLGTYREGTASLRTAIPDYNFAAGLQPGITTGMLTSDATNWPVQTYLIDNIPNLYKSDATSQFGLNAIETEVTIHRADTTSNVSAFSRCSRPLVAGLYRRWRMTLSVQGRLPVVHDFVVPESSGRYLTVNEVMNFASEFLHTPSLFAVQLWDFQITRESEPQWRPVGTFLSSPAYDGDGTDYGVHLVSVGGQSRVEFSNQPGIQYIPANTIFSY